MCVSFKKLLIDMVNFNNSIKIFFETKMQNTIEIERKIKGKTEEVTIKCIESNLEYKFNMFSTKQGITLNFSGYGTTEETRKNIFIPMKDWLLENCSYQNTKNVYTIKGMEESTFEVLIECLGEEDFDIEEIKTVSKRRIKIKSEIDKIPLTLTYYSNKTLLVQGKTSYCYWAIFKLLIKLELINTKTEEEIVLCTLNKKENEKESGKLTSDNEKLINYLEEDCKIMFKTFISIQEDYKDKLLLDYSFLCFYPLRISEAILRKVITDKITPPSNYELDPKSFKFVNLNDKNDIIIIFDEKKKINGRLTTESFIKDGVEALYLHYSLNRHGLFHAETFGMSRVIEKFEEANQISQEAIRLIKDLLY
jgi:hypothetical protein